MRRKPIIGITVDSEKSGSFSTMPHYALRENYADAISNAQAVPLLLPHHPEAVSDYVRLIDGLLITGGGFDIDPKLFGAKKRHKSVTIKERRTAFEWKMLQTFIKSRKPILGVCGGEQLLNVVLGGTLIQHIPDEIKSPLNHLDKNARRKTAHAIQISSGTKLFEIVKKKSLRVNSSHHQAVLKLGKNLIVSAIAPDGVIEAIEMTSHPFCIGVQWHPEYHLSPLDAKIFKAFVKAAKDTIHG